MRQIHSYLCPLRAGILLFLLLLVSIAALAQTEVSYRRGATQLEDILPPSPDQQLEQLLRTKFIKQLPLQNAKILRDAGEKVQNGFILSVTGGGLIQNKAEKKLKRL